MKGYLIFTGTELLLGKTLNTNSQLLTSIFAELGIDLHKIVTVGDNINRIIEALNEVPKDVGIVFLNGGLGPTEDDVTKEALLEYLSLKTVYDQPTLDKILKRVGKKGLPGDLKVAEIPEGGLAFYNDAGVAPGSVVEENGKHYFLTPGPPEELSILMKNKIIPYLKENMLGVEKIHSRTLKFAGIGESKAEDKIRDLIRASNPTVAPTIKDGEIHFRVTAKGENREELENIVSGVSMKIIERLEDYYFGNDDETLESLVAGKLTEKKLKIAVAESCTGGLLSNTFTNISGSSDFFDRAYITYNNQAKIEELNVKKSTLEQYGAVSENTAIEMAEGVFSKTNVDLAISITGIAGPTGGTIDKPVGLVYIAFKYKEQISVVTRIFSGNRLEIKNKVVKFILFEIFRKLKED
ncbi:MAG: competence/damage-inducible protein A [Firmicutes bacterium]|nr:competence/damage-inducible protein A [Bacillota bacterium]